MTEYTLEQIKSYQPPKKLPAIAGMTYDLYDAGGFKLDEDACEKIRAELKSKFGDLKALTDDLCGLSAFIMFAMEVRNDPVAAETVAKLIGETKPAYAELGASLTTILQDMAKQGAGAFDKFQGKEDPAKARAPKVGEEAPAGALPLSKLKPVATPPIIPSGTMKKKK